MDPLKMRLLALLGRAVNVRGEEVRAVLLSFAYFFCLLCGYYILRPLREEMGIAGGVRNLPWLFTGTFAVMLVAVPAFGAAVSRFPRKRLVTRVPRRSDHDDVIHFPVLGHGGVSLWSGTLFLDLAPVVA